MAGFNNKGHENVKPVHSDEAMASEGDPDVVAMAAGVQDVILEDATELSAGDFVLASCRRGDSALVPWLGRPGLGRSQSISSLVARVRNSSTCKNVLQSPWPRQPSHGQNRGHHKKVTFAEDCLIRPRS